MRGSSQRFRLARYFTATSLVVFAVFGIVLYYLERAEGTFFDEAQREHSALFASAQAELVHAQEAASLDNVLKAHEAGHVALATVLANALWESHVAPLVAAAERLPIGHCRDLPGAAQDPGRRACFAAVGREIMALPGFARVDAAVRAATRKSAVFKIKVYDLRGVTVYSSEHAQVGEDKAQNRGWISAVEGRPASELVHRDRFSAFEGVVEDRNLIQSYLPVRSADGPITGIFEIYSDVTPLLRQIDAFSNHIKSVVDDNESRMGTAQLEKQRRVESNSDMHLAILGALMVLLYLSLLVLVRYGQRIIDEQARAREQATLREQMWHREKMAALATMAANASHEIGNPLAVISGAAEEIAAAPLAGRSLAGQAQTILEQASRIAAMTRQITEFVTAHGEKSELIDVNRMVKAVGDFLGFDSRYRAAPIEMRLADRLPACAGIPDHLKEVLMSLVQAYAEISARCASGGRAVVRTEARGSDVAISVGCECGPPGGRCALSGIDPRLDLVRVRVEGMGGRLTPTATATEIVLPSTAG